MKRRPIALAALAALPGCISVEGPCGVTIQAAGDGARSASVDCDAGGSATVLAPARAIEAVVERRAPEAAP